MKKDLELLSDISKDFIKANKNIGQLGDIVKYENKIYNERLSLNSFLELLAGICSYAAGIQREYFKDLEKLKNIAIKRRIEAGEKYKLAYESRNNESEGKKLFNEGEILEKSAKTIESLISEE